MRTWTFLTGSLQDTVDTQGSSVGRISMAVWEQLYLHRGIDKSCGIYAHCCHMTLKSHRDWLIRCILRLLIRLGDLPVAVDHLYQQPEGQEHQQHIHHDLRVERCGVLYGFLYHPQLDVFGDGYRGSEEVKLKLAMYMALIDAAVIIGDVDDLNGDILQVLAPIPGQTALKWSIQFNWSVILILVYMSFVGWGVFFFCWHVVPIHTRLCFDLFSPHTSNAGQLHGCPQDCFCRRRDINTYWLAQVNYKKQKYQSLQMNSGLSYHIKLFLELLVDSVPLTVAFWSNP